MNGALLIDKPSGITSAKVVALIKKKYSLAKIGHCGTLDPLATGLLVVLCGQATRLQSLFMGGKKAYQGIIQIGQKTSTDDIEGQILEEDLHLNFLQKKSLIDWEKDLGQKFLGKQLQVPPQISAIKISGKSSYKRVRAGEDVELSAREIEIEKLSLKFLSNTELEYDVECSKGTYVRSLARDIGEYLGSYACIKTLRRTYAEPFFVERALGLDELGALEEQMLTLEELLSGLTRIEFSSENARKLLQGEQSVLGDLNAKPDIAEEKIVYICDENGRFISLLEKEQNLWKIRFSASS